MLPRQSSSETRQRLLVAAAEVFAAQGYRHARISDICERAKANIAAVNYHFGDKERLYLTVIQWLNEDIQAQATYLPADTAQSPVEQLQCFIRGFLSVLLCPGPASWLVKLMAQEMIEPTKALDYMLEAVIRPVDQAVRKIVGEILGLPPEDARVFLSSTSLMGQCMIYHGSREITLRIHPEMLHPDGTYKAEVIAYLAEHITMYSLRGMGLSIFPEGLKPVGESMSRLSTTSG